MEDPAAVLVNGVYTRHPAVLDHEVDGEGALHHPHLRGVVDRFGQGADDLGAGGILGVQDAAAAVRGLAAEGEIAGRVAVEARSQGRAGPEPARDPRP